MRTAIVLLLIVSSLAQAQNPEAPQPSTQEMTLWAHANTSETALFMNTLRDDGAADGAYMYPGTGAESVSAGADESFEFRLPLDPALGHDLMLDPDGTIEVLAYLGGGTFTAGRISASVKLVSGETTIAQSASVSHELTPAAANEGEDYNQFLFSFAPTETTIPAGADLTWIVSGSGSWNNLFMSAGENRGRSYMTLPIAGISGGASDTAPISYQNLSSDVIELDLAWANATGGQQYNWTAPNGSLEIHAIGNITGNLTIIVANGTELFNQTLNGTFDVAGISPGGSNWTIHFMMDNVNGTTRFTIGEPAPVPSEGGPEPNEPGMEGNGTTGSTDGKDSPAAPVALLIGALGLIALRRRD